MNLKLPDPGKKADLLISAGIFLLALAIRTIQLGQFLTSDEPVAWLGWSIEFIQAVGAGRFADTFFSFAPGVTLFWSGSFGLFLAWFFDAQQAGTFLEFVQNLPFDPIEPELVFWFRFPNALIASLCIAIAYPLAKGLLGQKVALVAALLLLFDPLFIGMTRVLGHDGVVTSFMLVSTLALMAFFINHKTPPAYGKLALSAFFAGLALLTKSTSFFLFPFAGLVALAVVIQRKQPKLIGPFILYGLLWLALIILTFIIFWPALWVRPFGTVYEMFAWLGEDAGAPHNRGSFFAGQPIPDPGIWFYWVAGYFRLTAITTVGLFLGIIAFFVGKWKNSATKATLFLLLAYLLFFLIFLSLGAKKQDRYLTPTLPVINLIAATGYVWLCQKFIKQKVWQNGLLTLAVILQAAIALAGFPYYLSHYNLLAGGAKTAPNTLLVGWGEGLDQAAAYLNTLPNAETVKANSWYHTSFEPFFHGQAIEKAGGEKISRSSKPALAADYTVLYINQIQRQMPTPGLIQYFRTFPPEHTVTINGIDYAYIYPAPGMEHPLSGEIRLVGQAELLGYNLTDDTGAPLPEITPDKSTIVQLYWEWQGKQPDELIGLALVDDAGQTWGWGNPLGTQSRLPFEQWQEGMIVHDDFALLVFPGTPPGQYTLKFWIDRPTTGERVGDFPIAPEMRVTVTRPTSPPPLADLNLSKQIDAPLFGGDVTLLGLDGHAQFEQPWQPGETRTLLLYWQADQSIEQDYPISLSLLDSGGTARATWTSDSDGGRFPTSQWQPGDIIRDPWALTLPPNVPPGSYQLMVQPGDDPAIEILAPQIDGRPRQFKTEAPEMALSVAFGPHIQLLGLRQPTGNDDVLQITPGQSLTINPVWRANNLIDADYTITAQLLDAGQQVIAQRDSMPQNGGAPTTTWAAGEVIPDEITLEIPPEIGAAPHQLLLALYHGQTGQRLLLPNGADHLTIPVTIQESGVRD